MLLHNGQVSEVEIRSALPLSSLLCLLSFLLTFSSLCSTSICFFFLFICFPLEPKIFERASQAAQKKCVSFSKYRGFFCKYSQISWSIAAKLSVCTLPLRSYPKESALSFPLTQAFLSFLAKPIFLVSPKSSRLILVNIPPE